MITAMIDDVVRELEACAWQALDEQSLRGVRAAGRAGDRAVRASVAPR